MKLLDLSHPMTEDTPRSSDHPAVRYEVIRHWSTNSTKTRQITASLHSGTHVDAPSLYDPVGLNIDQLPLEGFCGTGLVIDLSDMGDFGVISADVLDRVGSEIRPGDIFAMWTGWANYHFADEERYVLKSPGLDKSGVDWLISHKVKAIFSDTPSSEHIYMRSRQWQTLRPDIFGNIKFDPAQFPPTYAHRALLPAGVMMVEHLSENLGTLVGQRVNLMALPVKYGGVEGAPTRAVAILEFP
jgi:kynurenine formamidase